MLRRVKLARSPGPLLRPLSALLALAAAATLVDCSAAQDSAMPGTALGTFTISAALSGNSCGSGTGAPNPWSFSVDLSRDGQTLYWRQNGNVVQGAIDASGNVSITGTFTGYGAGLDGGATTCALSRTDAITVVLGTTAAPTTFSGTIGFHFGASSSPDCALQLTANGGAYDQLPCDTNYTYTASQTKAP